MITTIEILQSALTLIQNHRWMQGCEAAILESPPLPIPHRICEPLDARANAFCAIGAVRKASQHAPETVKVRAVEILAAAMLPNGIRRDADIIADFNDAPGRTKEDIEDYFLKAIELAK